MSFVLIVLFVVFFFFFQADFCLQAEDGIRVGRVTGVQTCALPIGAGVRRDRRIDDALGAELLQQPAAHLIGSLIHPHLFAHQKDVGIALHFLAQRLIQGVPVGERRHQSTRTSVYSSSGSGSGLSSANFTAASTSAWTPESIASSAA